jgi:hypothetical protein
LKGGAAALPFFLEVHMSDKPANQFDGELAALRHQREMESLAASPAITTVLDTVAGLVEKTGLPGSGLFRKALKNGQTPVETLVDQLEAGALSEIRRIWKCLEGQDERLKEFETRLQSREAQDAYLSAIFHGLRTSDPEKRKRLGLLTINCVLANDLSPESLDETMRASVELNDRDISVLRSLSETQRVTATYYPLTSGDGTINRPREVWQEMERNKFITLANQMEIRSSLERLKAMGLCAEIQITDSNWLPRVLVTPLGERFVLRLDEGTVLP